MRIRGLLICASLLSSCAGRHQSLKSIAPEQPVSTAIEEDEVWTLYYQEENLLGYKNSAGEIVVKPQYMRGATRSHLKNIAIVSHAEPGGRGPHYRTKTTERLPHNTFWFDNTPDCEHEDHIRYKDETNTFVGLLNGAGKIVIPAIYNWMTPVYNGYVFALDGAQKVCLAGSGQLAENMPLEECEHKTFKGGVWRLLDKRGRVLVDEIDMLFWDEADLYSLPKPEHFKQNMKPQIFEDTFKIYLDTTVIKNMRPDFVWFFEHQLYINDELRRIDAKSLSKVEQKLRKMYSDYRNKPENFWIRHDELNSFVHEHEDFSHYKDLCGDGIEKRFPVMSLIERAGNGPQRSIDFLKTQSGFRLIGVSGIL